MSELCDRTGPVGFWGLGNLFYKRQENGLKIRGMKYSNDLRNDTVFHQMNDASACFHSFSKKQMCDFWDKILLILCHLITCNYRTIYLRCLFEMLVVVVAWLFVLSAVFAIPDGHPGPVLSVKFLNVTNNKPCQFIKSCRQKVLPQSVIARFANAAAGFFYVSVVIPFIL